MTKLTKEQIEKERVKFIDFYCVDFSSELAYQYNNELQQFSSPFIDSKYRGWLARAELDKPKSCKFLPLTDKQLNVLSYIEQYINEQGYSPKLKEVQNALNFKSESSINAIVKHLIKKGYLIKKHWLERVRDSERG